MNNTLTEKERSKLLDTRLNQDHLLPFIVKWLNIEEIRRPSHIQDMLKRFANMSAKAQKPFYVDPISDELIILDKQRTRRTTYIKVNNVGWKESKYY
jgi:hypothetical protein